MKSLRLCLAFFLVFTSINILKKNKKKKDVSFFSEIIPTTQPNTILAATSTTYMNDFIEVLKEYDDNGSVQSPLDVAVTHTPWKTIPTRESWTLILDDKLEMVSCIIRNGESYELKVSPPFKRPGGIFYWFFNDFDNVWQRIRVWPSKDPSGILAGITGELWVCNEVGRDVLNSTSLGENVFIYRFM
jgi:hypothetical protein